MQTVRCFAHASLGDCAYGEAIFSTADGHQFLVASAIDEFAQRLSALIPQEHAGSFWRVLAMLADTVDGKPLTHAIVCPVCKDTQLESWGGNKVGSVVCADASFLQAEQLSSAALAQRVAKTL